MLFPLLSAHRFSRRAGSRVRARRRFRPGLWDGLEGRVLLSGSPTYYTVNLTSATGASSGTDGTTGTPSGDLLWAVTQANANTNPAGSVIEFDPTVFNTATPRTITLGATLTIDPSQSAGPVVVNGPGASIVTIKAPVVPTEYTGFYGVYFGLIQVDAGVTATVSGLTISAGLTTNLADAYFDGGGISNSGTLTVSGCVLSQTRLAAGSSARDRTTAGASTTPARAC